MSFKGGEVMFDSRGADNIATLEEDYFNIYTCKRKQCWGYYCPGPVHHLTLSINVRYK